MTAQNERTCPFCGWNVEIHVGRIAGITMFLCTGCGATVSFQHAKTKEEAIESFSANVTQPAADLADYRLLVRELDVLLNGEDGASKQVSLCDIVSQVSHHGWKLVKVAPAEPDYKAMLSLSMDVVGRVMELLDLDPDDDPDCIYTAIKELKGGVPS